VKFSESCQPARESCVGAYPLLSTTARIEKFAHDTASRKPQILPKAREIAFPSLSTRNAAEFPASALLHSRASLRPDFRLNSNCTTPRRPDPHQHFGLSHKRPRSACSLAKKIVHFLRRELEPDSSSKARSFPLAVASARACMKS